MSTASPIRARRLRLTRTDECGVPVAEATANSRITRSAFITVGLGADVFRSSDIQVAGADGSICVRSKGVPSLLGYDITIQLCNYDTAIFEMVFEIHPSVPNGTVIPINFSDDLSFFPPSVNQGSVLGQAVRADMIGLGTITAFCGGEEFLRGDHNEDSTVSISDVVHLIDFLFTGGPASGCERSGDTNGDEAIDIADAITLVSALFEGSTTIPAPFPVCDVDLVGSPVPCATYAGACP